jgi:hypothetical protein
MWRSRWNVDWQGKPKFSEKTWPSVTFVHHKIPHDQNRVWTRTAVVGNRRLTAWAMERPFILAIAFRRSNTENKLNFIAVTERFTKQNFANFSSQYCVKYWVASVDVGWFDARGLWDSYSPSPLKVFGSVKRQPPPPRTSNHPRYYLRMEFVN